jgi:hypothetical protein
MRAVVVRNYCSPEALQVVDVRSRNRGSGRYGSAPA